VRMRRVQYEDEITEEKVRMMIGLGQVWWG
jgi:hypothetical protein